MAQRKNKNRPAILKVIGVLIIIVGLIIALVGATSLDENFWPALRALMLGLVIIAAGLFVGFLRWPWKKQPKREPVLPYSVAHGTLGEQVYYRTHGKVRTVENYRAATLIDGKDLAENYYLRITPENGVNIEDGILDDAQKEVGVESADGKLLFSYDTMVFASAEDAEKCELLEEYLHRGDPVVAVLRSRSEIELRFFTDLRATLGEHESEIYKLIQFQGADAQIALRRVNEGDRLLTGKPDIEGRVSVFSVESALLEIGCLPKTARVKAAGAPPYFIILDHAEQEDVLVPFVKIYW